MPFASDALRRWAGSQNHSQRPKAQFHVLRSYMQHAQSSYGFYWLEIVVLGDQGYVVGECCGGNPEIVDVQSPVAHCEVDSQQCPRSCDRFVDR